VNVKKKNVKIIDYAEDYSDRYEDPIAHFREEAKK
jgi:hypothetical protein